MNRPRYTPWRIWRRTGSRQTPSSGPVSRRFAAGISTPAKRVEAVAGLKGQGFLAAQGKNIMPTGRDFALFVVLEGADPVLVDPGVIAELEYLLNDFRTGRQEMMVAIDAVCDSAQRTICRPTERSHGEAPPLGEASGDGGDRVPTGGDEEVRGVHRQEQG